ncbi:MAG: peptidylprolyl isomerase [Anaerolineae bacterium]|nr:peptidylprolyl isomerase [Anaerolineae bacterium]MDK1119096.1 peptidylprolyl isomerase [Anaerolineae bacterium]
MQKLIYLLLIFYMILLSACANTTNSIVVEELPATAALVIPTPALKQACTNLNLEPTPGPDAPSLFPAVSQKDHIRGNADAAVTIVIYDDFQCTECNYLRLSQLLLETHPKNVRFVYRHFSYTALFDKSEMAARAAEAAADQGKFWEMHDILFEMQAEWVDLTPDAFERWLTTQARALELDKAQFTTYLNSKGAIEQVKSAAEEAEQIGIPQIPFYLINGQIYQGPTNFEPLSQVISLIALGEQQFTDCPPFTINPEKQYLAKLETEKGELVLLLYPDKAPLAVNSFVFLAQAGWFDNITFHRVLPGFVAQTGDPSGTGQGNPGYIFNNESHPTLNFDRAGLVAMANSGPDTNGSQFFITYAPAPELDGNFTIFGKVLSGMDVLEKLTARNPQPGLSLAPGDKLIRVSIEEN